MSLSPQILQTYFMWLRQLDVETRRTLIERLAESVQNDQVTENKTVSLFGSWQGNQTAEEILADIYANRNVERTIESF
ncbi:MAG: hypothetical protein EAZ95_11025 [Bacteroidetes bacterium]|nr:MAG: hypothetical protein EAZ95_11025 [Bacteroidota bacterium]